MDRPGLLEVLRARETVRHYVPPTPLCPAPALGRELGVRLFLKREDWSRIRSFKARGGVWRAATAPGDARGLACASTGNFAQGIALAARLFGKPALAVVPRGTSPVKLEAVRELGAEVIIEGGDYEEARRAAPARAQERGFLYVEEGEDAAVLAGTGTLALEVLEDLPEVEVVLVPVGCGNLLAAVALGLKSLKPEVTVVGVQSEAAPAVYESWLSGRPVVRSCRTWAEGLSASRPGSLAFEVIKALVDEVVLVSEELLGEAVRLTFRHTVSAPEPAGAAGVAALLRHGERWRGRQVVCIVSGGNIDYHTLEGVCRQDGRDQG